MGILQARILEWVAILFSRVPPQPKDQTGVSCIAGRFFTIWATREAPVSPPLSSNCLLRETCVEYMCLKWPSSSASRCWRSGIRYLDTSHVESHIELAPVWLRASACNKGTLGLIPGSGRSPGEGNGNPLQYSCLENSMDGGVWWATVHEVAKSWTRLTDFTFIFPFSVFWGIAHQEMSRPAQQPVFMFSRVFPHHPKLSLLLLFRLFKAFPFNCFSACPQAQVIISLLLHK